MIDDVVEISKEFMKTAQYVYTKELYITELSKRMLSDGKTKFPTKYGDSVCLTKKDILYELIAGSINYCYWYGKHDIRPHGAGSLLMYNLLNDCFNVYDFGKDLIELLIIMLTQNRFPLLEERIKHLHEILENGESYANLFFNTEAATDAYSFVILDGQEELFEKLLYTFPGYASDIFLKRASLFFLQLYRRFGVCEQLISKIHVPADYQVPKLLRHFNCISYSTPLNNMIYLNELIPKHSIIECEIRAAAVVVCQKLSEQTGWNISDIDAWLWLRRKECNDPFHLTITTDY